MSDDRKIVLNYEVGVEYYVPSKYVPVKERAEYNPEKNVITSYVPDIELGDMVRWAVPAGKQRKDAGIPLKYEYEADGWIGYEANYSNLLQYEDMALVLEKRMIRQFRYRESTLHVRVLTNHGIGWVEARYVTRVNKR